MVERPIKKSERQTHAAPSDAVEEVVAAELNSVEASLDATSQVTKEQITIQPIPRKNKTKGQGKGSEQHNEPLPINRALVRGPKPKKLEVLAIKQSQAETPGDAINELSQPTDVDG